MNERVILFLDEIDKIANPDSWLGYIRGEIFDTLDGVLRPHLRMPREAELDDSMESRRAKVLMRVTLAERLRKSTFCVGAGTFETFFETQRKSHIGFRGAEEMSPSMNSEEVAMRIPRELSNRFSSDLIRLPDLQREDYLHMVNIAQAKMPSWLGEAFGKAAAERLDEAIRSRKACRFLEDSLLAALRIVKDRSKSGEVIGLDE